MNRKCLTEAFLLMVAETNERAGGKKQRKRTIVMKSRVTLPQPKYKIHPRHQTVHILICEFHTLVYKTYVYTYTRVQPRHMQYNHAICSGRKPTAKKGVVQTSRAQK